MAIKQMPLGGKRAKMGTGRARSKLLGIWLDDARFRLFADMAEAEGVTRTALFERWIDEHAALSSTTTPVPEGYQVPE